MVCAVAAIGVLAGAGQLARAQRGQLPPPMIEGGVTQKIAEHVYVIPDFDVILVPVTIVVGTRGALVVDTGLGARNGQIVMRVEKVSKGPELYLAATHIHPEHDLGAGGFPARTKMLRSREQEADIQETGLAPPDLGGLFTAQRRAVAGRPIRKADIGFDRDTSSISAACAPRHGHGRQPHEERPRRVGGARLGARGRRPGDDGAAAVHGAGGADCHLAGTLDQFDALKPAASSRAMGRWAMSR